MAKIQEKYLQVIKKENPVKRVIESILSTRWYVLLIGMLILLKTVFFYGNTVFKNDTIWAWSIRQTCFFIVILVFPLLLFKKSVKRFEAGMVIDFFVSLLLFADELYYEYASNILSVMQMGNMQYKDEILNAIPSLLHFEQILYFADFIVLAVLLISKAIHIKNYNDFKWIPVALNVAFVAVFCTYYHFIPESLELVNGFIYSKYNSVRYGTIYGYHYVDIKNAITNNKNVPYNSYDEMLEVYADLKNQQKWYVEENNQNSEKYTGIAEGMNVFVVQLESVQQFVINRQMNGKEITPNLNRFFAENIHIANMHASSYTTTADSEHSFITSIYPSENGEAFSKYYSNTYNDIFKNYKKAGYTNVYAHGNYDTFWNRKNVFSKYDVDKVYFINDFEDTSELIRTYLSDELLYKQIFDMLPETDGPIFADIVAASSHKPFDLEGIQRKEQKITIDVGKYRGTALGDYLESVHYADYAFGIFLEELKTRDLYDNSVVFVYGDHYGMTMYDEDLMEFLGEDKENYNAARMQFEFSNVACGMRIPGVSELEIDYPVSKVDIKPTLMQIANIEDTFSLGNSIFEGKPYVCVNNGKIIKDGYYYDTENWYDLATGEMVNKEMIGEKVKNGLNEAVEYTDKELGISMSVLIDNLLKDEIILGKKK